MSADNRICIMKCGEPDFPYWAVWHGSLSQDYYEHPWNAEQFDNEQDMQQYADKLAEEIGFLEGGVTTISKEEQLQGLTDEIERLQYKLKILTEK